MILIFFTQTNLMYLIYKRLFNTKRIKLKVLCLVGMTMDEVCALYYSKYPLFLGLKKSSYPNPYTRGHQYLYACSMDT